jgi:hypothetical protein
MTVQGETYLNTYVLKVIDHKIETRGETKTPSIWAY